MGYIYTRHYVDITVLPHWHIMLYTPDRMPPASHSTWTLDMTPTANFSILVVYLYLFVGVLKKLSLNYNDQFYGGRKMGSAWGKINLDM